jgi:hypothetical protein
MISYDSIYFGYTPNYDPDVTMAALNTATGQKGAALVRRNTSNRSILT